MDKQALQLAVSSE